MDAKLITLDNFLRDFAQLARELFHLALVVFVAQMAIEVKSRAGAADAGAWNALVHETAHRDV